MDERSAEPAPASRQARPTVANLLVPLRVRLALLVVLLVTFVVATSTYLELRLFQSSIAADLVDSAKSTAQSVADDLELRVDPMSEREDVADTLREFLEAVPSIRVLSVLTFDGDQAALLASTSSAERPEAIAIARQETRPHVGDVHLCPRPSAADNLRDLIINPIQRAAIRRAGSR